MRMWLWKYLSFGTRDFSLDGALAKSIVPGDYSACFSPGALGGYRVDLHWTPDWTMG